MSVRITVAVGLLAILVTLAAILSRSPITVVATNSVIANPGAGYLHTRTTGCQAGGTLPAGTSAIRLSLLADVGPSVAVKVLAGSRVLTHGRHPSGWGTDETVTVPVRPVQRTSKDTVLCTSVGPAFEFVQMNGTKLHTPRGDLRGLDGVALRAEYLRPGTRSWLSSASSISRRVGLGHAAAGTWIVFLLLLLSAGIVFLVTRLILEEPREQG